MLGISNVYCEGEEDSVTLILYDVFVSVFKIKKKMKSVLHFENYSLYTKSCNDSLPCHSANDFPSSFAVFAIYLEWAPVGPHSVLLR